MLSAGLHGGALVANYPYDNIEAHLRRGEYKYAKAPDDDVFIHISKVGTFIMISYRLHQLKILKGEKVTVDLDDETSLFSEAPQMCLILPA